MNKEIIGIDLDDVTFDFSGAFSRAAEKTGVIMKPLDDWTSYAAYRDAGLTEEQFFKIIIDQNVIEDALPCPGAIEAINRMKASGATVAFVTSRGYHPRALPSTIAALERHGIPYDDIIIVPHGMNKAEAVMAKYPKGFSRFIDDHVGNLESLVGAGLVRMPVLITRPWNKDRADFKQGSSRFSTLKEYVDTLQQEVVVRMGRKHERDMDLAM